MKVESVVTMLKRGAVSLIKNGSGDVWSVKEDERGNMPQCTVTKTFLYLCVRDIYNRERKAIAEAEALKAQNAELLKALKLAGQKGRFFTYDSPYFKCTQCKAISSTCLNDIEHFDNCHIDIIEKAIAKAEKA